MRRLTLFSGTLSKRVFPLLFYAALGVFTLLEALDGKLTTNPTFLLGPAVAAGATYVFQRLLISDTADDVIDCGSYLLVRRGATKDRIDLSNVLTIDASLNLSPPLMTLHLVKPSKFGRLVSFIPIGGRLNPIGEHPLARELMRRAHAARIAQAPTQQRREEERG